jgi:hypothetical protein
VSAELSALCHGELDAAQAARVMRHVERCDRCRAELELVRRGVGLAGQLVPDRAPENLWTSIVREVRDGAGSAVVRPRRHASMWMAASAAAAVCVVLAGTALAIWQTLRPSKAWLVASLGGSIQVGGVPIGDSGTLPLGGLLETGPSSRATIAVGRIGQVDVEPNSSVRLAGAGWTDHRLVLERGSIRATIFAPPRVFFVDTPTVTAVDLGCAYALTVDATGASALHVTSGWVALESDGRQVFVPAGASCRSARRANPGTPFFDDAPPQLIAGVRAIDGAGDDRAASAAVGEVLAAARPKDTLTLWHLIPVVPAADRARVVDRLAAISRMPEGVRRDEVLALDPDVLDRWRRTLDPPWKEEPAWRGWWRHAVGHVLPSR